MTISIINLEAMLLKPINLDFILNQLTQKFSDIQFWSNQFTCALRTISEIKLIDFIRCSNVPIATTWLVLSPPSCYSNKLKVGWNHFQRSIQIFSSALLISRRGDVPYFFVTVTVIVTVIMILAIFIFYFCLKQQDKHCIRHYDCDYDCDYDKKIRYKYGPSNYY